MKIRVIFLQLIIVLFSFNLNTFSQFTGYDDKFDLTICTMTRNAKAELYIKNYSDNTFTGGLSIDNDIRDVFGWYTEKKSEGGIYTYNTRGISFYVKLHADFQHQQLFEGLFNFDNTFLSGTYFYWGNEYPFFGSKIQVINPPYDSISYYPVSQDSLSDEMNVDSLFVFENTQENIDSSKLKFTVSQIKDEQNNNDIVLFPNPTNGNITIGSLKYDLKNFEVLIYTKSGQLVKVYQINSNPSSLLLKDIKSGIYMIKIVDAEKHEVGFFSLVVI